MPKNTAITIKAAKELQKGVTATAMVDITKHTLLTVSALT